MTMFCLLSCRMKKYVCFQPLHMAELCSPILLIMGRHQASLCEHCCLSLNPQAANIGDNTLSYTGEGKKYFKFNKCAFRCLMSRTTFPKGHPVVLDDDDNYDVCCLCTDIFWIQRNSNYGMALQDVATKENEGEKKSQEL